MHWHLLFSYEYELIGCLEHLLEIDQSRVLESKLEHHHLPQDLLPAWFPFPPLADKFGGHFFPCFIVDAFLNNSKLSSAKKKKISDTKNSETTNKLSTETENNKISSNILEQWHFDHVDIFLNNYINMINEECWCFYYCLMCSQLYWIVKILTENTA